MKRFIWFFGLASAFLVMGARPVSAATMSLLLDKNSVAIGDTFTATLRIDSDNVGVNAAQATVLFPKDLVEAVKIDVQDSVFDFWLEHPPQSNNTGQFLFIGGSTNGYNGHALYVWRTTFRVKGSGPIEIRLNDAAVSASDGSGTNILTGVRNAFLTSVPTSETWAALPPPTSTTAVLKPEHLLLPTPPVQIKRTAVSAQTVPAAPRLNVPLYPHPEGWSNVQEHFLVSWDLPSDVTDVATAYDQNPSTNPTGSEGLFDKKVFPSPTHGVQYVHVRFKNAKGWGETTHYRVPLDLFPPSPFTVAVEEGTTTDVPAPTILHHSVDADTRVEGYLIQVDDQPPIMTTQERFTLPLQTPGKHKIRVAAVDQAGNATEAFVELEIIPLPSPAFTEIRDELYVGEGAMDVGGIAGPSSTVVLILKTQAGEVIETKEAVADPFGNWATTFDRPLAKGSYVVEAVIRDARGATSFVVKSRVVNVRERPFLVLAGVAVGQSWFFSTVIFLLVIGFAAGWIAGSKRKQQRSRQTFIPQSGAAGLLNSAEKLKRRRK